MPEGAAAQLAVGKVVGAPPARSARREICKLLGVGRSHLARSTRWGCCYHGQSDYRRTVRAGIGIPISAAVGAMPEFDVAAESAIRLGADFGPARGGGRL